MPKNINTPRSELICGKLDSLDDEQRGLNLYLPSTKVLSEDIYKDFIRSEGRLDALQIKDKSFSTQIKRETNENRNGKEIQAT